MIIHMAGHDLHTQRQTVRIKPRGSHRRRVTGGGEESGVDKIKRRPQGCPVLGGHPWMRRQQ